MARPKKATTAFKTNQPAPVKKKDRVHAKVSGEKLKKATPRALEPDPWTGKQKTK